MDGEDPREYPCSWLELIMILYVLALLFNFLSFLLPPPHLADFCLWRRFTWGKWRFSSEREQNGSLFDQIATVAAVLLTCFYTRATGFGGEERKQIKLFKCVSLGLVLRMFLAKPGGP